MMAEYKIQSILGAYKTNQKLDLEFMIDLFSIQKEPNPPHAINFQLKHPKMTIIFYQSGIIAFMGAKSFTDLKEAKKLILNKINNAGIIIPKDLKFIIWNIVATADLKQNLDLELLSRHYYDSIIYDPEAFSGAIFHKPNSKLTVLAFGSGKIVLVGAKNIEDIESLLHLFLKIVEDSKTDK